MENRTETNKSDNSPADAQSDEAMCMDPNDKPDNDKPECLSQKDAKEMDLAMGDLGGNTELPTEGSETKPETVERQSVVGDTTVPNISEDIDVKQDDTSTKETSLPRHMKRPEEPSTSEAKLDQFAKQSQETLAKEGAETDQSKESIGSKPSLHVRWQIGETNPEGSVRPHDGEKNIDQVEQPATEAVDPAFGVTNALMVAGKVLGAVGAPSISGDQFERLEVNADEDTLSDTMNIISDGVRSTIPLAPIVVPRVALDDERLLSFRKKHDVSSQTSLIGKENREQNTEQSSLLSESGSFVSVDLGGPLSSSGRGTLPPCNGHVSVATALWGVLPLAAVMAPSVCTALPQQDQYTVSGSRVLPEDVNKAKEAPIERTPKTKRYKMSRMRRLLSYIRRGQMYVVVNKGRAVIDMSSWRTKDWSPSPGLLLAAVTPNRTPDKVTSPVQDSERAAKPNKLEVVVVHTLQTPRIWRC